MSFEKIVRGGAILTQGFGDTAWACSCRCEWTCPGHPAGCFHAGLDIAKSGAGVVLLSVGYGQVVRIGRQTAGCGGLGPYAPCVRSGGVDVWYGHAQKCLVGAGTRVVPGQPIAIMGSIGCSTGQHVHYEVLPAGYDPDGCAAVDPWKYTTSWPGAKPGAAPVPPPPKPASLAPWLLAVAGAGLLLAARRSS